MLEAVHFIHKAGYSHVIIQQVSQTTFFKNMMLFPVHFFFIQLLTSTIVGTVDAFILISFPRTPVLSCFIQHSCVGVWVDPHYVAVGGCSSLA